MGIPDFFAGMSRNKFVEIDGTKYMIRGLTFEEFVKLGSMDSESKDSKTVMVEVVRSCLIEPKLKSEQINGLEDKTLVTLVSIALDISRSNLEGIAHTLCRAPTPLRDIH